MDDPFVSPPRKRPRSEPEISPVSTQLDHVTPVSSPGTEALDPCSNVANELQKSVGVLADDVSSMQAHGRHFAGISAWRSR